MTSAPIIERLRIDPGQRTLGELIQDREAALHEIRRLQAEVDRLGTRVTKRPEVRVDQTRSSPSQIRRLINIKEVCELLGISRSSVHKRLSEGTFPQSVRVGPRTVRWPLDAIEAWRDSL